MKTTDDNKFSNLRVDSNLVVGTQISVPTLISQNLTTKNFRLFKEPLADANILVSDAYGTASWESPFNLPGLVAGDGTTGRIVQWVDGPNSDIGDTALAIAAGTITVAGSVDLGLTSPTTSIVLTAGEAVADAIQITASNAAGGIDLNSGTLGITVDTTGTVSIDAAAASNFSTTTGALTLASSEAGAGGQVVINSAGTGVSAVDINATAGGITVDYEAGSSMTITSGGTVITTSGTAAAPDLTVNNGDLVITGAGNGLVHTGSGTITQITSNVTGVTLSTTTGVITMFAAVASGISHAFILTNTTIAATSVVLISVVGVALVTGIATTASLGAPGAGSITINVTNPDGANATAAAPEIHFMVINV